MTERLRELGEGDDPVRVLVELDRRGMLSRGAEVRPCPSTARTRRAATKLRDVRRFPRAYEDGDPSLCPDCGEPWCWQEDGARYCNCYWDRNYSF